MPQDDSGEAKLVAALDVGSNTVRLLVARSVEGNLEPVQEASRFARLGLGVDKTGHLDPDRKRAGIEAISELASMAHEAGALDIHAVATSAIRDASDGVDFAEEVKSETGVSIRIISGDEEARLTFLGTTMQMDLSHGAIVCDIGGGSSEIIAAADDGIHWAHSLKIGSGRLSERFVTGDPPSENERAAISNYVREMLEELGREAAELAVFTGGTATNIVGITGLDGVTVEITLQALVDVENLVYSMPAAQITEQYRVRPERAQVWPAGVTTVRTIAQWSGAQRLHITRHGMREGVIIDHLQQQGRWPVVAREQR